MSFEIGKKYFGILHLDKMGISTPDNIQICLHTKYGNLYVIKKGGNCNECIGDITNCLSCDNVHCSTFLIKKYNKHNEKILLRFIKDRVEYMKTVHPESNWDTFYQDKLRTYLDSAI